MSILLSETGGEINSPLKLGPTCFVLIEPFAFFVVLLYNPNNTVSSVVEETTSSPTFVGRNPKRDESVTDVPHRVANLLVSYIQTYKGCVRRIQQGEEFG